jgi:hypothetical protein
LIFNRRHIQQTNYQRKNDQNDTRSQPSKNLPWRNRSDICSGRASLVFRGVLDDEGNCKEKVMHLRIGWGVVVFIFGFYFWGGVYLLWLDGGCEISILTAMGFMAVREGAGIDA